MFFNASARFLLIFSFCVLTACEQSKPVSLTDSAQWILTNPTTYSLHIPSNYFKGKLAMFPEERICHTQGLEIVDGDLFISCCLYNAKKLTHRNFSAESFLLKAPLSPILKQQTNGIRWMSQNFTSLLPASEQPRVTRAIMNRLPKMMATFLEWLFPLDDMRSVLGHPSGLIYDPVAGGIWMASAVYAWDSYSQLLLVDPKQLKLVPEQAPLPIKTHLGFVATHQNNFLWSINWSSDQELLLIDPQKGLIREEPRPVPNSVGYQDCASIGEGQVMCAGDSRNQVGFLPERTGLIHLLKTEGDAFDSLKVTYQGAVKWEQPRKEVLTARLGYRSFINMEEIGDVEISKPNQYGNYSTSRLLTNGGFAVDLVQGHAYFLPDDIPGGRLIRYDLKQVN